MQLSEVRSTDFLGKKITPIAGRVRQLRLHNRRREPFSRVQESNNRCIVCIYRLNGTAQT